MEEEDKEPVGVICFFDQIPEKEKRFFFGDSIVNISTST